MVRSIALFAAYTGATVSAVSPLISKLSRQDSNQALLHVSSSFLTTTDSQQKESVATPWGTTDCAEFTYHVVTDSTACLALCAAAPDAHVRAHCEYYSGFVNLCSATEYDYALNGQKKVNVPDDLQAQCAAQNSFTAWFTGGSVQRCKVCDRVMTLEEQDYVHDTESAWWWNFALCGIFLSLIAGCVGLHTGSVEMAVSVASVLLGAWAAIALYHVVPIAPSGWTIFNPTSWSLGICDGSWHREYC